MLVNILFGIITLLLIIMVVYIRKRETHISDLNFYLGYYSLRFGEFTIEQMLDWLQANNYLDD